MDLDSKQMEDSCPPAPPPVRLASLKKFSTLDAPEKCTWCVYAYILNKEVVNSTEPPLYGGIFPLGSFSNREKAEKHAKKIIEQTGHSGVVVAKYAHFVPLSFQLDDTKVERVLINSKGQVQELEDANYRYERQCYEEEESKRQKLWARQKAQQEEHSLESLEQNLFLACMAEHQITQATSQVSNLQQQQEQQLVLARQTLELHPEYREQWLSHLEAHCNELGLQSQYEIIKNAYEQIASRL